MQPTFCSPDTPAKPGGEIFPSLQLEASVRKRFNSVPVASHEHEATWGTNTISYSGEIFSVDDL